MTGARTGLTRPWVMLSDRVLLRHAGKQQPVDNVNGQRSRRVGCGHDEVRHQLNLGQELIIDQRDIEIVASHA